MPGPSDYKDRATSAGLSTPGLPPRSRDPLEASLRGCTRPPYTMVNRDLGQESQLIRSAAATGMGNEGIATLRFMRVIPGCRSVMAFRWDIACLTAVTLTIPLR